ncbi:MAG: alpha-glucoside transport system substrate-binding protein [Chloroflexota bacterium]|jgi:alpha-glucoside transport system substrate-binding protein|nr:alpha-glucoside transport system substrate-binding protein [Chloroflexota bacterium]
MAAIVTAVGCGTGSTASKGSVHVLAVWAAGEQDSFLATLKPFEDSTGIKVLYESTRDVDSVLATRIAAGNPPEISSLPSPATLNKYAAQGKLVQLDNGILDMNTMNAQYSPGWIKLGTINGKLYEIFAWASVKGLIWYDPKNFAAKGYTVPTTWADLMTLQGKIKSDGTTPWCIAVASGAASGWPGSDWVKEIVLSQSGPAVYDSWWQGKTKWTDPAIKLAWQTWGSILGPNDSNVSGGSKTILSQPFGNGGDGMFKTPPKCYMHNQASFITANFVSQDKVTPGTDFNFFPLPDVDPQFAGAHVGAGDAFSMLKDTPQARALIKYLTTPEAQAIWVKRGGKLSPNKSFDPANYPDDITRSVATVMTTAKIFDFDAGDLMPTVMFNAYWAAVLKFVANQNNLDAILQNLDAVQATAYK